MTPELAGVLLIPLITGLVEVAKRSGLPPRYAAGVAVALGIVLTTGSHVAGVLGLTDAYTAISQGASYGLAAAGLYSAARFMVGAPPRHHAQGRRVD